MKRIGFDNAKYRKLQSEKIKERIARFGGKLYLEFGGKLFDDFHASRVLPGFVPDAKIRMLQTMREQVEIIFCISAENIEKSKIRADLGISYDLDLLRQLDLEGCPERADLAFHRMLLNDQMPLSIGGGIGQSRLCMFMLRAAHIGEVQVSIWPDEMVAQAAEAGIILR